MEFKLQFNMDNAAFSEDDGSIIPQIWKRKNEVAGILNKVTDDYRDGREAGTIRDSNGNTVGKWEIEKTNEGTEGDSMLHTKEHYDLMNQFDRDVGLRMLKEFSCMRLDKEDKKLWGKSIIYEDGETNKLFCAYRHGYVFGRAIERR